MQGRGRLGAAVAAGNAFIVEAPAMPVERPRESHWESDGASKVEALWHRVDTVATPRMAAQDADQHEPTAA